MADFKMLVGNTLPQSDMKSTPWRLMYTQSSIVGPSVSSGQTRFTLPKRDYMDVSSLRWRAKLNVNTTDANARLAGKTVDILIDRVRVVQGTTVVFEQESNSLITNTLETYMVKDSESQSFEKLLSDYPTDVSRSSQVLTTHTVDREVVGHLSPHGTFLNSNTILPLKMCSSPAHIDIYWSAPEIAFLSTDTSLSYSLTDLELCWNGLTSPSLDQYFSGGEHRWNVCHYDHCYNQIPSATSSINLRIPSNHSSIRGLLTLTQDQANIGDITVDALESCFTSSDAFQEMDFRIQTKSIYDQAIDHLSDHHREFTHVFPYVSESKFLTASAYVGNSFPIVTNLMGAPSQFSQHFRSSLTSSALSTDMILQLKYRNQPTSLQQCDSYLIAESSYSFSRGMIRMEM